MNLPETLHFGLTPCPNDTFIFYKFLQKPYIVSHFHDVEELNQLALMETYPLIKVSCAAAVRLKNYIILESGGAMGYNCGPLLLANKEIPPDTLSDFLLQRKILIPGKYTTANFLFRKFTETLQIPIEESSINYVRYDAIIPALVKEKEILFGVVIHEERFTYAGYHLFLVEDLGEWWQKHTGLPIPLGCIVLHKTLIDLKEEIEREIRQSILYSRNHFDEVFPFIKEHAQTMDKEAIKMHIETYVTDFSYRMDEDGRKAIQQLRDLLTKEK